MKLTLATYSVVLFCALLTTGLSGIAHAATFTVTNTNDSGAGSLRQAIADANSNPGADTIAFHIPTTDPRYSNGVFTITPTSSPVNPQLSLTDSGTTIDGATQTAFAGDTNPAGPEIYIVGTTNSISLFRISGSQCTISSLAIGISGTAIQISTVAKFNTIKSCYIGLNPFGTARATNDIGILIDGASNNTVGGTGVGEGNVISANAYAIQIGLGGNYNISTNNQIIGNYIGTNPAGTAAGTLGNAHGVYIRMADSNIVRNNVIAGSSQEAIALFGSSSNVVQGNKIGTNAAGTSALPNGRNIDIKFDSAGLSGFGLAVGNVIGGINAGEGNIIANSSDGPGVWVHAGSGGTAIRNPIRGNSIYNNNGRNPILGIDLGEASATDPNGVTPNDIGDLDDGPNTLQNYPVISSVIAFNGRTQVSGTLNSTANGTFAIDLFRNITADPSGFGEGEVYVASTSVTTDGNGNASFSFDVAGAFPSQFFTTTATDSQGNTSEFGQDVTAAPGALTLSLGATSVSETGGTLSGTVSRNFNLGSAVQVTLSSSNTSAATVPATVTIPANVTSAPFLATVVDNDLLDGDKSISITASAAGLSDTKSFTVTDNERASLQINFSPSTFAEAGSTTGTVTITPTTVDTVVTLSSGQPAVATVINNLLIAAGQSSKTFTVTGVNDNIATGDRSATITATANFSPGGTLTQSKAVTVTDDEVPTLTLSLAPASIAEEGVVTATLTRNTPTTAALTVTLTSTNPSVATVPGQVTIPINAASVQFTVQSVRDGIVTGNRSVNITAAATGFTSGAAPLTVTNVDVPELQLTLNASTRVEGTNASGTVQRNFEVANDVAVTLSSSNTAVAQVPAQVTIPAGQRDTTFVVTVPDNALLDGTRSAVLTAAVGALSPTQTLTVTDNDVAALSLNLSAPTVRENSSITGTVSITPTTVDTAVTLGSSVAGVVSFSGSSVTNGVLVIPARQSSASFTITGVEDALSTGDRTLEIIVRAFEITRTQPLTVNDNEILQLTVDPTSLREGTTATGTVTITPTAGETVIAIASSDPNVAAVPGATLVIPAGQGSATFSITAVSDNLAAGDRSASISASAFGLTRTQPVAVTEITTAALTLSLDRSRIGENEGATATITRNTPTGAPLTVNLASADTRVATVDATVTIPAGAASAQFTVRGFSDGLVDGDQSTLIVADAPGFIGAEATITVTNTDVPTFRFTLVPQTNTLAEGASLLGLLETNKAESASLAVTLSSSSPAVTFAEGTRSGQNLNLTIPAGASSAVVVINAIDDTVVTGNRAVTLKATATGFAAKSRGLTITDNDAAVFTLSIAPTQFSEGAGAGAAIGRVTRNFNLATQLVVALTSSKPGEATVPATVTIAAGSRSATFAVGAVQDSVFDGDKSVIITAKPVGSTLVRSQTLRVTDDEITSSIPQPGQTASLSLSINPLTISEGGSATATVTRNTEVTSTTPVLSVSLLNSASTRVQVPPTVTIARGQKSANFAVSATQNTIVDGPVAATITARASAFPNATAIVTVLDNDTAPTQPRPISISGRVSAVTPTTGAALSEAFVTVSQGTQALAQARVVNGAYSFTGLRPNASYILSVRAVGYAFASQTKTAATTNLTNVNFVGTAQSFAVSGRVVSVVNGVERGVAGIAVTRDGLSAAVTTSTSGAFTFPNVPFGMHTLAARKTNFTFAPSQLRVLVASAQTNTKFTAFNNAAPSDITFTPASGGAGERVVITGRNFAGGNVLFGTLAAAIEGTPTATQIIARVPAGSAVGRVKITVSTTNGSATSDDEFTVTAAPEITSFTPTIAKAGAAVTISGRNLGGATEVRFNGTVAAIDSRTATQVRVRVPATAPAGPGFITVTTPQGTAVSRTTFFVKQCFARGARGAVTIHCNDGSSEGSLYQEPEDDTASSEPISTVRLSSASVIAASATIRLNWTGALDTAEALSASHWKVVVRGVDVAVESVSCSANGTVVTLGVAEGKIKAGELVAISWRGLHDARGHRILDSGTTFVAR